jgi:hypothetical protein
MLEANKPDELEHFAADLQLMRHRATNLGLHATGQQLDSAIQAFGFEIAGSTAGYRKFEAVGADPKRDRKFRCSQETPCPNCGSTEGEMRTYGGNWDDADCHCAQCGKLIRRAWSAI